MFTGIIECLGKIEDISVDGTNRSFWVSSPISSQLKIDQSVSHNGICLTVDALDIHRHRVTAIAETLAKTNLDKQQIGDFLNLERCLPLSGRLDGHLVQGHIDCTAICTQLTDKDGSTEISFHFPEKFTHLVIEKGSIAINGISLTLYNLSRDTFSVSLIPYTWAHTNLQFLQLQQEVNIEFDMVGKYIQRRMQNGY